MKHRILYIAILLCLSISGRSADFFWVGGSGYWNDAFNWSHSIDGKGGDGVPGRNDNVFINVKSSGVNSDTIFIENEAYSGNLNFESFLFGNSFNRNGNPNITLSGKGSLHVSGDLNISGHFNDQFTGNWLFTGTGAINCGAHVFSGTFRFNSNANYISSNGLYVNNSIQLETSSALKIANGDLVCKTLNTNGNAVPDIISGKLYTTNNQRNGNPPSPQSHTVTTVIVPNPCNGQCIATATAQVTGGSGNFSYQWSTVPAQTTQTATGLCAGTYLVVVTDLLLGDQVPAFAIVVDPPPLIIFFSSVSPLCNGQCNGSATASVAGGTPGYSYLWAPGNQTTSSITGQCAGTYTLTVTDNNNCSVTQQSIITQPAVLVPNGSATNVTCFNACNGTATVAPTGGTGPYSYNWQPGNQTTPSVTGLCPGIYTCTVTDANNCTANYTVNITQPAQLQVSTNVTNATCFNSCNGSVTTNVSGGVGPYSYLWLPALQTTSNITSQCAGTYTVGVTDANGCVQTQTATITQPTQLVSTPTGVNITCFNACNGTAAANASGGTPGYTYSWAPSGGNAATASGLCPGNYTVTVTDNNGCTATGTLNLTQPAQLLAGATSTNITCFNACNGSATANPTGGTGPYTYNWMPGNLNTQTISNLCPGAYTLTVTDVNNCTATQTVNITQPAQIQANITSANVTCNGACNGTATSNPSGGVSPYTYNWQPGNQTTNSISGLCPGTYTLTITDANGCIRTASVTITQPNVLSVSASATQLLCNNTCNATIASTVTGGTASYTYQWQPGGQTTPSITNQCAGTYTINVTDANGCTANNTVTITQPTAFNVTTAITNVSCFGQCDGSAGVTVGGATAPYTYNWQPGGQTTSGINGLCAGNYSVTITDANGCDTTIAIQITQPNQILPNITSINATCSGNCNGSATANPSGGTTPYTFLWSPGGQTTPGINGLCAGSYTVQITDANGCTANQTVNITQPNPLSAQVTSTTSSCGVCNGSASVTVSGGTSPYAYFWSPAGGTNPTATNLCIGNYTCTITDVQGCTTTASVNITQVVNIQITSSGSTPSCFGSCDAVASANASGGVFPYTFVWQPGNVVNQNLTGLCAGTYTVTATDANGCFSSTTITLSNPPQISATIAQTNVSCNAACNGTASVNASGGTGTLTYLWSPGGQTTSSVSGLCAGTYSVTVSDANGCDTTLVVNITEPTLIQANQTVSNANCTLCDGAISTAATGGTGPYTYSWAPGGQTTTSITNQCPGIYTVTITDATGCSTSTQIAVSNINGPSLTSAFTNASCDGTCDGTANVNVSGGNAPFTYDWSPGTPAGDGTPAVTGLCAGTYFVQVTDAVGCITFQNFTITEPNTLTAPVSITNASCNGVCDGSITVTPSGGTAPYTYAWSNGGTTPTISNLCGGVYTLNLSDAGGCNATFTFTVTEPGPITANLTSTNVVCNSACNGTAQANVSGGTAPFSYSWTSGPIVSSVVNLCPGTYSVTITDANGCSTIDSVTITEPPALVSTISSNNVFCFGQCTGTASVTTTGGVPGYAYLWSPGGQTTQAVNGLCPGAYSVTSTDLNGCQIVQSVNITSPPAINITTSTTGALCFGDCNGSATAVVAGGTAGYTYSWAPSGGTLPTETGLCSGTYTITVTDALGCTQNTTAVVTQPNPLQANTSFVSPTCNNTCNGSATANPIGGTGPYSYLWSPGGQTTPTINNICAGTYTVTVVDASGCSDVQIVNVTSGSNITVAVASAPANCGSCNGTLNITPSGGTAPYTYVWSNALPPQPNQTNLCAGLYTVTVTDASGCSTQQIIPMNNNGGPTGETIASTGVTCFGSCDGTATVTPIGGTAPYSYLWNPGNQTVNSLTGMCGGNYFLQVTDANGCIRFSPVTITEPAQINANPFITNTTCTGVCDGSIVLNTTGGSGTYTYQWLPGNQTTSSITNLCNGSYSVTITDSNGCTGGDTIAINPFSALTVAVTSVAPSCANSCDAVATANITSGNGPFTYQWTDPLGQNTQTASGLCAGTYTVAVTTAIGCNTTSTVTIAAPSAITVTPSVTQTTCGQCNGVISLTVSGGTAPYTYTWSNGGTTATQNGLCNGVYTVLVTDATGCSQSINVAVSSSSGPTASNAIVTDASCHNVCDGSASLAPTGGVAPYTYLWIPGGQTTSAVSNLCAGVYYVQITDATGCTLTDSIVINEPTSIALNQVITNTDCGVCNGNIALNPTGGTGPYTYSWAPGGQTTPVINGLCAGIYTVTVTDATGCSLTQAIPVSNINSTIVMSTTSANITCNGSCNGTAAVNVTAGNGPFTYQWSTGATTSGISGLCAGNYIVQVTDVSGCVSSAIINITQPAPLATSQLFVQNELCNGACNGFISAIASGGTLPYTFSWSNTQTSQTATGLCTGSYTVTITDANGCTATQNATIISPVVLVLGAPAVTDATCNNVADGSIDITVNGGTLPYTFQWSGPNGYSAATEDITNIFFGTYTVIITDANGCSQSDTITVNATTTLFADAGADTSFCAFGSVVLDGNNSINATGYQWLQLPGNTVVGNAATVTVNPPSGSTSYVLIITNGVCTDSDTVTVTSQVPPFVDAGPDISIITGTSTTIGGSPTGPSGSTYAWGPTADLNDPNSANPVAAPASTTSYIVVVTDTAGCTNMDTVVVTVVPMIEFPNGFTPNGDGTNDYWQIDNIQLFPNCEVEVYNRWGEKLFYSRGYNPPWDGRYNGQDLPVGTYYYIIKLNDPRFPDAYTGPVTIIR